MIDQVTAHLKRAFEGIEPQRASVTFLGLESIDVLRFTGGSDPAGPDQEVEYVSLGCSRHPMGEPDQIVVDPNAGPRGEIVIRMYASAPLPGLHRSVAMLAAAPAVEGLVLTADALIDLGEPLWEGSRCSAVVLEADPIPPCALTGDRGDVNFFRAIPVTANEAAWIRLKGVDALRAAWVEAGIDVRDPARAGATIG